MILDLWARFLGGEDLAPGEERALLEALESDEGLRRELIGDVVLDGLLRSLKRRP